MVFQLFEATWCFMVIMTVLLLSHQKQKFHSNHILKQLFTKIGLERYLVNIFIGRTGRGPEMECTADREFSLRFVYREMIESIGTIFLPDQILLQI